MTKFVEWPVVARVPALAPVLYTAQANLIGLAGNLPWRV